MKHIILLTIALLVLTLSACDSRDKTKIALDKSFREYIENNDKEKNYRTRIQHVEIVSYTKTEGMEQQDVSEAYRARVYFVATTSYEGSVKVYNINDTVTSYFDENLKMVRMINPDAQ